ncbi:Hypothetical predicted protein [Lecanosticta acicola]|uniref:Thioesterase/thiol ester dehydrase-isomerase n=1 Tax=Lecanosticta acicola TaxID=111012 RepID=A0AAI8YRD9_9PEZI|nr:Hypothetical predicted protein [Lecanosticta acicola]
MSYGGTRGGRPLEEKPYLDGYDGNTYRPFADLIRLEKIDDRTYRSVAPPFAPGGRFGVGRSYGAHVYCQAAWAACQTVDKGFLLHNVSGNFILAGQLTVPFVYNVDIVRNGRSYCTRIVSVTQSEGKGVCFTCICSFKTPEPLQVESQQDMDLWKEYGAMLGGKKPEDFPECPGMDVPFYWKQRAQTGVNDEFPGLECRRVDMERYNESKHPLDRKQLIFYRTIGSMPDDPNMHLCAHLYASDRNSLYNVANAFDLGDRFTQMSSLVHTVVFHSPAKQLAFGPGSGRSPSDSNGGRWFCMEAYASRIGSGRALYQCRIWNPEGINVTTAMQDGLIRFIDGGKASKEEEDEFADVQKHWKRQEKL